MHAWDDIFFCLHTPFLLVVPFYQEEEFKEEKGTWAKSLLILETAWVWGFDLIYLYLMMWVNYSPLDFCSVIQG